MWIVPGSPALVRELSPADAAGAHLLAATRALAANLAEGEERPIDIVCSLDNRWRTERTGSFAAWGAPQVTVRSGNHLGELVARYALGDPQVREVRGRIGTPEPDAVTVVALDGPAGLTPRAPLALVAGAPELHSAIVGWLGGGPVSVDKQWPAVAEPALWNELTELAPRQARLIAADDTLGVGRYVAEWWV